MIGSGVLQNIFDEELDEIDHLLTSHGCTTTKAQYKRVFTKAIVRGITFSSKDNSRMKKRNAYTISHSSSESTNYGLIQNFFQVDDHHIAVIHDLSVKSAALPSNICDYTTTILSQGVLFEDYITYSEGEKRLIFVNQIINKCCNLTNNNWKLLTLKVNKVESD